LADSDAAVDALLRHTGVIRVDTLAELFDVASLLMHPPVPAGRRVAVMSNGGGPAIVAADACVAAGLEVPELSAALQGELHQLAPTGGVKNPVDLIATADADVFERATRLVLESGEVDALVVIYVAPYVTRADEIEGAIARAEHDATHDVALAACFLGLQEHRSITPVASGDRTVPVFAYPESAARALAHAAELGAWRRRPTSAVAEPEVDLSAARARVADALERSFEDGWMPLDVAAAFLDDYGVPMVQSVTVHSSEAAVEAARRIGYPVALKAMAPGLVHKADVGGVRLDLVDDEDLVEAYEHMTASVGPAMFGATVQSMVDAGVELIVGIHHDPTFGPLVLFGAGGFAADLDHDAVLLVPPLTDADIDEAIRSLRRSPLLFGYRSSPQVDVDALHDLLARVGRLASDIPEIAELDCNPVIATPAGAVVVDAKVRLVRRPDHPNPFDPD
jgi:acyl-CoA synthetase (NDP forming)